MIVSAVPAHANTHDTHEVKACVECMMSRNRRFAVTRELQRGGGCQLHLFIWPHQLNWALEETAQNSSEDVAVDCARLNLNAS